MLFRLCKIIKIMEIIQKKKIIKKKIYLIANHEQKTLWKIKLQILKKKTKSKTPF